jgi:hypothetical protein
MSENPKNRFKSIWTPSAAVGNAPFLAYLRARLVNGIVYICTLVLVPAIILIWVLFHFQYAFTIGVVVLAIKQFSTFMLQMFQIRLAFHLGYWTGWKRETIRRDGQAFHYWAHAAMHLTILPINAAAAALLFCIAIGHFRYGP